MAARQVFFGEADYAAIAICWPSMRGARVAVWSWVLMPNHVHLILVPTRRRRLRRALSQVHRAYAGRIQRARSAPGISGRAASAVWRWTSRICSRPCAMWRSTRCGRGWSRGQRTGAGRACTPCLIRLAATDHRHGAGAGAHAGLRGPTPDGRGRKPVGSPAPGRKHRPAARLEQPSSTASRPCSAATRPAKRGPKPKQ